MERNTESDREHRQRSGGRGRPRPGRALLGCLLAAASLALAGCGGSGTPSGDAPASSSAPASDSEWKWLQESKRALDAQRARLREARAAKSPQAAALEKQVSALGEELDRRLVDYINANPLSEGEKPAGSLLDAIRTKSDEDIELAHEFIEKGGDYRRAIEIYEAALAIDPDNHRLREEMQSAEAHRYMTAARFSQVKKGMTQDEVRAMLGAPNVRDIRDFPQRGITAWFYTKDADGRAAAVWFARDKSGPVVYRADFDAVDPARGPQPAPKAP